MARTTRPAARKPRPRSPSATASSLTTPKSPAGRGRSEPPTSPKALPVRTLRTDVPDPRRHLRRLQGTHPEPRRARGWPVGPSWAHLPVDTSPHRPCGERGSEGRSGSDLRDSVIREEHDNKSAPDGAPTPDVRGLADREEHDRLMSIMPLPTDPSSTCTDPHVDGCGGCVTNVEPPEHVERRPDGCSAYYRCSDCGHEWTTSWGCR